jgi:hypothetical protein
MGREREGEPQLFKTGVNADRSVSHPVQLRIVHKKNAIRVLQYIHIYPSDEIVWLQAPGKKKRETTTTLP